MRSVVLIIAIARTWGAIRKPTNVCTSARPFTEESGSHRPSSIGCLAGVISAGTSTLLATDTYRLSRSLARDLCQASAAARVLPRLRRHDGSIRQAATRGEAFIRSVTSRYPGAL